MADSASKDSMISYGDTPGTAVGRFFVAALSLAAVGVGGQSGVANASPSFHVDGYAARTPTATESTAAAGHPRW